MANEFLKGVPDLPKIDGAEIEVRRDRWGGIHVGIFRGVNPKFLDLTEKQAAFLAEAIISLLGERNGSKKTF